MRHTTAVTAGLYGTAMVLGCAALAACSNDRISSSGGSAESRLLRDSLVVSGPLAPAYAVVGAAVSDSQLVYISLPPGTIAGGDSVRIASVGGSPLSERLVDGGFDPIAVYARAADSIPVAVFRGGEEIGPVFMAVPSARPPTVVRTSPPKGKHDVPLNQLIVIVFSQPIDPATVTSSSVQLTLGGTPVPATLTVQPNQPWVVRLAPNALLAPNATYTIAVNSTIKDASGLALHGFVSNDFTSGTAADSVASVAVFAVGGFARHPSPYAVASPGGTVQFLAYKISSAGDTLTPTTGTPTVWFTSDASLATVDATGLAKAIAAGGVVISACSDAICGQGSITVEATVPGITPTRLGDLGGGESRLYGMAGNYVTGWSTLPPNSNGAGCRHAYVWSAFLGMEDLGTLPGHCSSYGWLVNASGTVIGATDDASNQSFIWTRAAGMQPLPDPDAVNGPWFPGAINENGDIAFTNRDWSMLAVVSATTGAHVYAGPSAYSYVSGLNKSGQLAVSISINNPRTSTIDEYATVAYVVDGSTGQIISRLEPHDLVTGQPLTILLQDINDNGMVAGMVDVSGNPDAFRWTAAGGFSYLASQGAGITTRALALNNAGDATVYLISYRHIGTDSLFEGRSAVWMADGTLVLLGGLGGTHTFANGINDNHQAAGHSQVGSNTGPQQAVLWNLSSGAVASVSGSRASAGKRQPTVAPRVVPPAAPRVAAPAIVPPREKRQ
jgi:hypothetical protein